MKQYQLTIMSTALNMAGSIASAQFSITLSDSALGYLANSTPSHAAIAAPGDAAPTKIRALVEASPEYAHAKTLLDIGYSSAAPGQGAPMAAPVAPAPALTEAEQRKLWVTSVDDTIALMIFKFTRFQMPYEKREAAAIAYRDSGYTIDPTIWITRFADNNGLAYPDACERILAQAEAYRIGLEQLEAFRMDKYQIERAPTQKLAREAYNAIMANAQAVYEALP